MNILFTIIAIIIAIAAFLITWAVSEFFIPPRDHWTKSGFTILIVKLGMCLTVVFYVFTAIAAFFGG